MGVIRPNPTVRTVDGATSVKNVDTIKVSNGDLTISGRTASVDTSGSASIGGSIADTQVAFGSAADTISGDSDLTFITDSGSGPTLKISGNQPHFIMQDDTDADNYEFKMLQSGSSMYMQGTKNDSSMKEFFRLAHSTSNPSLYINQDKVNLDTYIYGTQADPVIDVNAANNKATINGELKVSSDTNAQLLVESTSDDGTAGPEIRILRTSASPVAGDYIGALTWYLTNASSSPSDISIIKGYIGSTTAGSESGDVYWYARGNGSMLNFMGIRGASRRVEINPNDSDIDFVVNGDTTGDLLYVDAGNDIIGIGGMADPTISSVLQVTGKVSATAAIEGLVSVINVTGDITLDATVDAVGQQYYVNVTGSEQELTLPNGAQVGSRFSFSVGSSGSSIKIVALPGHSVNGASDVTRTVVNDVNWCTLYARDGSGNNSWIVGNA